MKHVSFLYPFCFVSISHWHVCLNFPLGNKARRKLIKVEKFIARTGNNFHVVSHENFHSMSCLSFYGCSSMKRVNKHLVERIPELLCVFIDADDELLKRKYLREEGVMIGDEYS